VVTSTQAFMWAMLRTAGVEDRTEGYGALFREH
jgi:maleate cis-trans isomerase